MKAALALLREFGTSGRRIVASGDMRELGTASDRLHYQLGQEVVTQCGADRLVACGEFAEHVVRGAIEAGMPQGHVKDFSEPLAATQWLRGMLAAGDVLLVKGSRQLEMDRLIDRLRGEERQKVA
jgi:UDP-N-acetylmuramoyl-tripeptide--D-alanyl-D-alanine ligase